METTMNAGDVDEFAVHDESAGPLTKNWGMTKN
jgi:hypothetical protein